jgi:hypothetical protein
MQRCEMDRLIVVRNKFKLHLTRKYLTRPEMLMLYSGSTVVEHSIQNSKLGVRNPQIIQTEKNDRESFISLDPVGGSLQWRQLTMDWTRINPQTSK